MSGFDFKIKYLAAARSYDGGECYRALTGELLTEYNDGATTDDRNTRLREANCLAHSNLVNSMCGSLIRITGQANSDEFPDGCAKTAWDLVMKRICNQNNKDKEDFYLSLNQQKY